MPASDAGAVLKNGTAKPGGADVITGGTAGDGCFEVGGACNLEDKLTPMADEHLEHEVVEAVVMLSMMFPGL